MSDMNKALFLDRDGTIIYDKAYLSDPDRIELLPGSIEALKKAQDLDYQLFLFTNQSGIARAYFTHEDVHACHARMLEMLGMGTDLFTEICIAPEHPNDEPVYRKPSPRFIKESIQAYALDPEQCYMIGDRASDWQAGLNAGIKPVALKCGVEWDVAAHAIIKSEFIPVYDGLLPFVNELEHA